MVVGLLRMFGLSTSTTDFLLSRYQSSYPCVVSSAANLPADCINLGQGYMNFAPPTWVKEAANDALNSVVANHYSHPKGRIALREAIRDHYSPLFGRNLDVESEILVTSGANEGITMCCRFLSFVAFNWLSRTILRFHCFPRSRR